MVAFSGRSYVQLPGGAHVATAPVFVVDEGNGALQLELHTGTGGIHVFRAGGTELRLLDSRYEAGTYVTATIGNRVVSLERQHLDRLEDADGPSQSIQIYSGHSGHAGDRVCLLVTQVNGQEVFVAACAGQSGLRSFHRADDGSLTPLRAVGATPAVMWRMCT